MNFYLIFWDEYLVNIQENFFLDEGEGYLFDYRGDIEVKIDDPFFRAEYFIDLAKVFRNFELF